MPRRLRNITATVIRQRFAATCMPLDPLAVGLPSPRWPQALQDKVGQNLLAAAVLIPIIRRREALSILRRADQFPWRQNGPRGCGYRRDGAA